MAAAQTNEVDRYVVGFSNEVREILEQLRVTILEAAPDAEECVSYKMPAYKYHGMLVCFAAYKNHIGFYPMPSGIEKFKKELSVYKGAKGSVQFPLDKPLPWKLIAKIVAFRAKENRAKAAAKTPKKK
jgi:uncharacterized protein YdhG (YjbR/CyaY superfamily)